MSKYAFTAYAEKAVVQCTVREICTAFFEFGTNVSWPSGSNSANVDSVSLLVGRPPSISFRWRYRFCRLAACA